MKKKILFLGLFFLSFLTIYAQEKCNGECKDIPVNQSQRGWVDSHGSPSWGTSSVWTWSRNDRGEGVNYSGYNFVKGQEYCVSFTLNASTSTGQRPNANASMNVRLTENPVIGNRRPRGGARIPAVPNPNQQIMTQNQNIWSNVTGANIGDVKNHRFTFTATSNFNNLWFYPRNRNRSPQIQVAVSNLRICRICDYNEGVAFNFEHKNGTEGTVFNLCEDVYLDGAATTNTGSYFMDIWKVNSNNSLSWLSSQGANGWLSGHPSAPINITDLFKNDLQNPVTFQAGTTYEVKLAINHPQCGWSYETHRFTYQKPAISSLFTMKYACHDGVYDVTATATDTAPNQWWMVLETNVAGSTSDANTVGPASSIQGNTTTTFTNLNPNKFYYIKHGVWTTNCGWQETRTVLKPDCCTDAPQIFPYCEDPCALDSFPLKVKDKNGNIITSLSGATFKWYNKVTQTTSTNDIVMATGKDHWILTLTTKDGCVYNLEYQLKEICCKDDIKLKAFKCPSEEDVKTLYALLENKEGLDKETYEKHVEFMNTYKEKAANKDNCDPCETGIFIIKAVDASGNLVSNFTSITWSDGLYANQNIRWGNVDTTYTVTVISPSSNGIGLCTYKDSIIYNCKKGCKGLSAPTNLKDNGSSLSWDPVPGAVSYIVSSPTKIAIDCCGKEGVSIAPITTTTNSVNLPGKLKYNCFVWQVTAVCEDGTKSPVSKQMCHRGLSVIKDDADIIKIKSLKATKDKVSIYPNPNSGNMNIKIDLAKDSNVILNIFTVDGNLVKTVENIKTTNGRVDFNFQSNLQKGVYLFNFNTDKGKIMKRVIVE